MASQASIIPCGTQKTVLAMAIKFLAGPSLMAVCSIATGLRGIFFKVAIVQVQNLSLLLWFLLVGPDSLTLYSLIQAALPQGIVPFVFAKEYNLHPAVLSTGYKLATLSDWISKLHHTKHCFPSLVIG